jgi:hypothetical protein
VVSDEFSWVGVRGGEEDGDSDEYVSPIKRSASVSGETAIAPATAAMTKGGNVGCRRDCGTSTEGGGYCFRAKFSLGFSPADGKLGPKFLCSIFRFYLGRICSIVHPCKNPSR